jgi:hypothetical protein
MKTEINKTSGTTNRIDLTKDQSRSIKTVFESHISANFLCNFMRRPEFLKWAIRDMTLKSRYFEEDISYLGIPGFSKLTFPMLCFCDIPLSKAKWHMDGWKMEDGRTVSGYGQYGVALDKTFCQKRDVQPINYLNQNSALAKSFAEAFQLLNTTDKEIDDDFAFLPDVIQCQLMYTKPIQGFMRRGDSSQEERLFKDECEWRYIPILPENCSLPVFIRGNPNQDVLNHFSDALNHIKPSVNFSFSVDDIVYLIVPDELAALDLIRYIRRLKKKSENDRNKLISKIEIADRFSKNLV